MYFTMCVLTEVLLVPQTFCSHFCLHLDANSFLLLLGITSLKLACLISVTPPIRMDLDREVLRSPLLDVSGLSEAIHGVTL